LASKSNRPYRLTCTYPVFTCSQMQLSRIFISRILCTSI